MRAPASLLVPSIYGYKRSLYGTGSVKIWKNAQRDIGGGHTDIFYSVPRLHSNRNRVLMLAAFSAPGRRSKTYIYLSTS